jgi:hypothetical protein
MPRDATQVGSDDAGHCQIMGIVRPGFPERATARPGMRMKEYLQCAKRAGLLGGYDARCIASSAGRYGWLTLLFSPSEIDQWQNRPQPVSCFSSQMIRERDVGSARREGSN